VNNIKEFYNYLEDNCFFLWVITNFIFFSIVIVVVVLGIVLEPAVTIMVVFIIWLISMIYQYRKFNKNG
jgi:uncharacterized membrane protein YdbT with pleckstrin-like domain